MDTPLTPDSEPEFFVREERLKAVLSLVQHAEGQHAGESTADPAVSAVDNSLFPECILNFCEQRSEEWFEARIGNITASAFKPWLTQTTKAAAKARHTAICRCLSSKGRCYETPHRVTEAMQRGIDLEPEAVAAFERWSKETVLPVGFAKWKHGNAGCSPDGLIAGASMGFEGKAPEGPAHYDYLLSGVLPPLYYWQVHGSMAVMGAADGWWFQSFHPGQPTFRILVKPNDDTKRIAEGLHLFVSECLAAENEAYAKWIEENKS